MNFLSTDSVKFDCRFYDSAKPCKPHKKTGVICPECAAYQKVEQRVLIIKFAAVGDVLRTTSVLPAISEKHPNAAIYWITSPAAEPIFENNPYVFRVLSKAEKYLPLLDVVQFDAVYNLEADHYSSLLASKAHAKQKFGFLVNPEGAVLPANSLADEWFLMGINDELKKQNKKTYFELLYEYCGLQPKIARPEIFLSSREQQITKDFFAAHNLGAYRKILGVNMGAGKRWPLKKWLFEYNLQFLERMHEKYIDVGIILFGGPDEYDLNKRLTDSLSFTISDAGTDNTLRKYFALVDSVDILLTPDSLAMQVGVALGKEVITYTGPTSYTELDMFGKGEILHSDIDCLVCYLTACEKETNCMNTLSVDTVFSAVSKYL